MKKNNYQILLVGIFLVTACGGMAPPRNQVALSKTTYHPLSKSYWYLDLGEGEVIPAVSETPEPEFLRHSGKIPSSMSC